MTITLSNAISSMHLCLVRASLGCNIWHFDRQEDILFHTEDSLSDIIIADFGQVGLLYMLCQ